MVLPPLSAGLGDLSAGSLIIGEEASKRVNLSKFQGNAL